MRAATMGARIIRNLSWLIIIAIFVAGSAAKGEERPPFLGGLALSHVKVGLKLERQS